jgi:hypothetical protein
MIIAQSFKVKNENGFSEEQFLSTTSDLVFMDKEMKENLTYRVETIQEAITDLEEGLNDEILRATKAEEDLQKNLDDAIAQEVIDRNAAIKVETDRAVAEEGALLSKINTEATNRATAISQEVIDRNAAIKVETDNRVLAVKAVDDKVNDLGNTLGPKVDANTGGINSLTGEVETLKNEIGTLDVDESGATISIAIQLANIIARLEVIEQRLDTTTA